MTGRKELGQNTSKEFYLASATNKLVVDHATGVHLVLHTLEEERVLADLSQLHKLVGETLDATCLAVWVVRNDVISTATAKKEN
jgi:hypothetical protein